MELNLLADTSIWVDHFRSGNETLATYLHLAEVWCHPFIIGELACGNLANRQKVLSFLSCLPQAPQAENSEVLEMIEIHQLMGRGIGWIDVHLIASAKLAHTSFWTLDRRLHKVAQDLGIAQIGPS